MPPAGSRAAQFHFQSSIPIPQPLAFSVRQFLAPITIPIPNRNRNLESNSNSHSTQRTHVHVIVSATLVAIFGSLTANDVNFHASGIPEDMLKLPLLPSVIFFPFLSHSYPKIVFNWCVKCAVRRGFHRAARQQLSPNQTHARVLSVNRYVGIGLAYSRPTNVWQWAHYNLPVSWR